MGRDKDMNLTIPDQFQSLYDLKKTQDPDFVYNMVPFKKSDVDAVDKLVSMSRGRSTVSTDRDWTLLSDVITFFSNRWPREWKQFVDVIPDIRHSRGRGGYSESRETKYVGALPPRLMKMIKIIFPQQQFDKEFVNLLVKRYKIFKVGGELN